MAYVSGLLLDKKSGLGISNLIVMLYDLDNISDPEIALPVNRTDLDGTPHLTRLAARVDYGELIRKADRMGSAITDLQGRFNFEVSTELFSGKDGEKKPDLLLLVLKPEEPGLEFQKRLLFTSHEVVLNAAPKEATIIQFEPEFLREHGVRIPGDTGEHMNGAASLEEDIIEGKKMLEKRKKIFRDNIIAERERYKETRQKEFVLPVLDELSNVPKSVRDSKYFIRKGVGINGAAMDNIKDQINEVFDPGLPEESRITRGYIYLGESEKNSYASFTDPSGQYYILPDDIIKERILPKLFRTTPSGSSQDIFLDHPAARTCRESAKTTPSPQTGPAANLPPDNNAVGASESDINVYVANQMNTATSPEQELAIGLPKLSFEKRSDNSAIQENLNSTIFHKGPADVPAYYDFHSLKIAFENVWQETFDKGLVENAEKWYDMVDSHGGDPRKDIMAFSFGWDTLTDIAGDIAGAVGGLVGGAWDAITGGGSGNGNGNNSGNSHDHRTLVNNQLALEFPEAIPIWSQFSRNERVVLLKIANLLTQPYAEFFSKDEVSEEYRPSWKSFFQNRDNRDAYSQLKAKGKAIINCTLERVREQQSLQDDFSSLKEANSLRDELLANLKSNYAFKHYAANKTERAVNFGILLTYQQKWEPLNYQAGELVKTIPLAPKENRRISHKTVVKKHRSLKEQEDNLRISKEETADTSRAESEIISKAMNKTVFDRNNTNTTGIGNEKVMGNSNTTTLNLHNEAQRDSQQTKRDFRESVLKAAREFRSERKVEIMTDETAETEHTESGEISNPNDELTVTYLFYELQRQFRVSEHLNRIRPVVLVAQEMPSPDEIDNEWVISHDWIIRRVLLDDSFIYAIESIFIINGEKLLVAELEKTVKEQRQIVKDLRQNVLFLTEEVSRQNRLMMRTIDRQAEIVEDKDLWDGVPILGDVMDVHERVTDGIGNFFGFGGGDDPKEAARIRTEAATSAYERVERERKELLARLEAESKQLSALSKDLAVKRKTIIEKEIHIARFKTHIKSNIFYYMQAIWSYEYNDQRFFRLMDTKVPQFTGTYRIKIRKDAEPVTLQDFAVKGKTRHSYELDVDMQVKEVTLKEVADLSRHIGFIGNYMLFGLNKSNILTDYMMAPYVDSEFGLTDPDNIGNWSLADFEKYVSCLRKTMGDQFTEIEEQLNRFYAELLQDPLRTGDLVTIPTGSLFIEALPGAHTILEYFKLAHRYVDVKKVQAEVRGIELENIRYAARIVKKELEDPQIEKKIVVDKDANIVVNE